MSDQTLQHATRLLLEAIEAEDEARQTCEDVTGAALFLSLGTLNEATALRKGYARAVNRLLQK